MGNVVATTNVLSQIGQEATPGAGGSASKKLRSLMIEVGDELTVREIMAQGHRFDTGTVADKAWSSWQATMDALDYCEHLYLLENIFGTAGAPTLLGTQTQKRTYNVAVTGGITPATNVFQFGDPADNVNVVNYLLCTDYGETWDRNGGIKLNGAKGIGQVVATGGSFTPAPTSLKQVPIGAADFNVYLDTTWAALGTTQITDEINVVDWAVTGMKAERWAANRANASFAGHIDTRPKTSLKITLFEGAVARPIVSALKAGGLYFLRLDAQGPQIETGTPNLYYLARRDFCVKLLKINPLKDNGGVYGRDLEFVIVEDPTSGNALTITSQTKEASL